MAGGYTVFASVESSGLYIEASESKTDLGSWVELFIKKASIQLGFIVKGAEA